MRDTNLSYFKPTSPLENFLCSAIAMNSERDLITTYNELGDKDVWDAASANRIAPVVGYKLMNLLGEEKTPRHWLESYNENHKKISAYLEELDRIAEILSSSGIPLIALKNGGIARGIYQVPGCVPMGDIDTLVRRSDFRSAHKILSEIGYVISAPNRLEKADVDHGFRTGGSEYSTTLPNGLPLWLELQWRPIAGRWLPSSREPKADALIERSTEIKGSSVRLLAPEDNLLQVALHTAKHSYVRAPGFRLHLDVDRIVKGQRINWDSFMQRVADLKVTVPVYFSLAIPSILFNTQIPREVLRYLRPKRWKRNLLSSKIKKAGLFYPDNSKFGKLEYILFTSLLFDDFKGLMEGIFPEKTWMKDTYDFNNNILLPYYHLKRLIDLMFRRMPV